MGYYIELEDVKGLKFYNESCSDIICDIKDWAKNKEHLMWMNKSDLMKCVDIVSLFDILRYEITYHDIGRMYEITDFYGQKLGQDKEIFEILAKYLKDGYIKWEGEDGDILTLKIDKHKMTEEWT